jgi:hypothetical protein
MGHVVVGASDVEKQYTCLLIISLGSVDPIEDQLDGIVYRDAFSSAKVRIGQ